MEDSFISPSALNIIKSRKIHRRVFLNVGGEIFETLWSHLARHPDTRLGLLGTIHKSYWH